MDNEKNHSIVHGGNDIAKYADVINRRIWVLDKRAWRTRMHNLAWGVDAALKMMKHALRTEASVFLCEGAQDIIN